MRIEHLASDFLSEIDVPVSGSAATADSSASRALGELLRVPLSNHASRNRLLLVAEGGLTPIPFPAIQLPATAGHKAQYLIESWETSLLPSGTGRSVPAAAVGGAEHSASRELAVIADPVYSTDDERVTGHKHRR